MIQVGYDYQDAAMQPPDEPDVTPQETMERCSHCNACLRLCGMLYYVEADPWDVMECADCDEWEDA